MFRSITGVFRKLLPAAPVADGSQAQGLAWYVRNGAFFKIMESLSIGAFLTAYALELGASNFVIGLLAAIPQLAQFVQLPAVPLVERVASRRRLAASLTFISRLILLAAAGAALIGPSPTALGVVVIAFAIRYVLGAAGGCAFSSWMRDFLPKDMRGLFVARRLMSMTIAGIVASLAGGALIDWWTDFLAWPKIYAFSTLLVCSTLAGAFEAFTITRIPEAPRVLPEADGVEAVGPVGPLADPQFRSLLSFLFTWNFAVNLAAPFFVVHMLTRIGLGLTTVVVLTVLSQIANAAVLTTFGAIADRVSNKRVLLFAAPLFVACIFAWVFTTMPGPHFLTLPLLVLIHIFTGVATAGVTVATTNMTMAFAPDRDATRYLATAAVVVALSAGAAPVLGGLYADVLSNYEVTMTVHWRAPGAQADLTAFDVTHWDFYFLAATVLGLLALMLLGSVKEEDKVPGVDVAHELMVGAWRGVQTLSSVAGLKAISDLPFVVISEKLGRKPKGAAARTKPPTPG